MFQRRQEIRTQTAFFFADGIQVPPLQQQSEKALSKIFCLFRPDALSSYETVNRSPICPTEFFEGLFCCRRRALRCQHHTPVSCCKRDRSALCSGRNLISGGLTLFNRHVLSQTKGPAKSKPALCHVERSRDISVFLS